VIEKKRDKNQIPLIQVWIVRQLLDFEPSYGFRIMADSPLDTCNREQKIHQLPTGPSSPIVSMMNTPDFESVPEIFCNAGQLEAGGGQEMCSCRYLRLLQPFIPKRVYRHFLIPISSLTNLSQIALHQTQNHCY